MYHIFNKMLDFFSIPFMFLFVLCMIETMCNFIFLNTRVNFTEKTNLKILFELVRKIAKDGQKKPSFDGQAFFRIIKEAEILDSQISIKNLMWNIWIPIWARTLIYKYLEYIEFAFKIVGLKNAASLVHFVLQLFRIQCVYDLKKTSKKESIDRILQIALNLGQLEGRLGIIFPFGLDCFIIVELIKIYMSPAAIIKNKLINYDNQLSSK